MRNYSAARWIWGVIYYVGLIALVLGFLGTGIGLVTMTGGVEKERSQAIVIAAGSAGAFVMGLLAMGMSDLVLAVVDTASNTQEMLNHMRQESERK